MALSKYSIYSGKNKLIVIVYSICSYMINKIDKGLKRTYDFTSLLQRQGVAITNVGGNMLKFKYAIEDKGYEFVILDNSSDSDVFTQIILEEEYKTIVSLLSKSDLTIIDAGANVGFTSIYLSHYFKQSKIFALEPNEGTYKRLKKNIEINNLDNVKTFQIGLWSSSTYLKADNSFRDGQDWSFRLVESSKSEESLFKATSISDFLLENDIQKIDFFKMDIEGGEDEIFRLNNDLSWLNIVRVIAVEIHDEFNCRNRIEKILSDSEFEISYSGELTIGVKNNRSFEY